MNVNTCSLSGFVRASPQLEQTAKPTTQATLEFRTSFVLLAIEAGQPINSNLPQVFP